MANKKISGLANSLTKATVAANDLTVVVDTSASESKKMTYGELMSPTDANFRIAGSSDNTKLVAFEVDGLTTATTRTLTVPDANTTLVGTDTTATLTNKTLTSPVINVTSDTTGDMYYRNSGGLFTRLPIGTAGQIPQVSSGGIPEWIANPAAADASTTIKGVVEIATDAEMNAGTATGATGAILAIAASSAGAVAANKLVWFTAANKYPANDGSLITNIVLPTATYNSIPNTLVDQASYLTYQVMPNTDAADEITNGFAQANATISADQGGGGQLTFSATADALISTILPGNGAQTNFRFADIGASAIKIKFRHKFGTVDTGERMAIGVTSGGNAIYAAQTSTADDGVRFVLAESSGDKLFAVTSNAVGASNTNTDVTGAITLSNWNTYEMVITSSSVLFYINGTLVATHTTSIPNGTNSINLGWGIEYNGGTTEMVIAPTIISLPLS